MISLLQVKHIICMPGLTNEVIDRFIGDVSKKLAKRSSHDRKVTRLPFLILASVVLAGRMSMCQSLCMIREILNKI